MYEAGKGAEGLKTVTFCDAFKILVDNFLSKFGLVRPIPQFILTLHFLSCNKPFTR